MNKWKKTDKKIEKYGCIKNSTNMNKGMGKAEYEFELHGKYGYIWKYNTELYRAIITSAVVANRNVPGSHIKQGEEMLITFPKKDLEMWIDVLKIPRSSERQLSYAKKYN